VWLSDRINGWLSWLTDAQHNLRSFSVLRILYALGLLSFLLPSIPERSLLWGPSSFWVDPEAKRRGYFTFDLLMTKSNEALFDLAYFGLILLVLLFLVGFQTRLVTVLMLIMLVSLHSNNAYVLNGGDTLYRITLAYLLLANLGAHYSVDAWMAKRWERKHGRPLRRVLPEHIGNAAHNAALVLCCFQIIVVYTTSGVWKLIGDEWLSGTALFYALRLDTFMTFPAFNELLWQSTLFIYVSTFVALWAQSLFPFAVLWRPTRILVLFLLMGMHTGIAVLLGLWPFSLAMIALDMLYVRDSTWVSIFAWGRRSRGWIWLNGAIARARTALAGQLPAPLAGLVLPAGASASADAAPTGVASARSAGAGARTAGAADAGPSDVEVPTAGAAPAGAADAAAQEPPYQRASAAVSADLRTAAASAEAPPVTRRSSADAPTRRGANPSA